MIMVRLGETQTKMAGISVKIVRNRLKDVTIARALSTCAMTRIIRTLTEIIMALPRESSAPELNRLDAGTDHDQDTGKPHESCGPAPGMDHFMQEEPRPEWSQTRVP